MDDLRYVVEIRDEMEMKPKPNGQIEPLCKFGPGGDFIAVWQPELTQTNTLPRPLAGVFAGVAEIVSAIIGWNRGSDPVGAGGASGGDMLVSRYEEKIANAVESRETCNTVDPSPASAFEDGGVLSGEPMLFPDLGRDGVRIEPKPKHRVRARQRVAKERSALRLAQQGTLFDLDFASARLA
jgi:hypothetical protein